MATGDNERTATAVSDKLGWRYYAEFCHIVSSKRIGEAGEFVAS